MAFPYTPYQTPYYQPYQPPMPDQLAQLRQNQMQQPMTQPMQPQAQQFQMQQPMMNQPLLRPAQDATSAHLGPVDDRIWVQGQGAAESYLMAANGFVRLWDSTAPVFYEKQADAQGKPLPLHIFDYTERTAAPRTAPVGPQAPQVQYVTLEEFNALADRLTALENKPCECADRKRPKKEKEEVDNAQSNL